MATLESVGTMIREFGKRLELPQLALDESSACTLWFDERIEVDMTYDADRDELTLECSLGSPAEGAAAAIADRLLKFNTLWPATQPAVMAIDPETGTVIQRALYAAEGLDGVVFEELLGEFVNLADAWLMRLSGESEAPVESPAETGLGAFAVRV